MNQMIPLSIELGNFGLYSQTSLNNLIWFSIGLALLLTATIMVLWWLRQARRDPFIVPAAARSAAASTSGRPPQSVTRTIVPQSAAPASKND